MARKSGGMSVVMASSSPTLQGAGLPRSHAALARSRCPFPVTPLVAGSKAQELVALRGSGEALNLLPDARYASILPTALLTTHLAPIYGRPPDAKLPA